MAIFVIGDLHLSFHENKPMSIFGENWKGHEEKIKKDWIEKVKENDLVVLPGDFSWSTYLKDTYKDFSYLNKLPGKKMLLKGNHDYWWTTLTSMRKFLEENRFKNIDFIYNTAYEYENYIIAGTRGWIQSEEEQDVKLLQREMARLELSLKEAATLKENTQKEILVFLHYPPMTHANIEKKEISAWIEIMKQYDVKRCYYGHLHSLSIKDAIEGNYDGIELKLVSADRLDFKLLKI